MAVEKGRSFTNAASAKPTAEVNQLEIILDFCYAVQECMDNEGITRKELARRLGKTPSAVTRILSGEANITTKTIAEFMSALHGLRVMIVSASESSNAATESYVLPVAERRATGSWNVGAIRQIQGVA